MLRTLLLVIGVLIIILIAFDGWRRKHKRLKNSTTKFIEPKIDFSEQSVGDEELSITPTEEALVSADDEVDTKENEEHSSVNENIIPLTAKISTANEKIGKYKLEVKTVKAEDSANQNQPSLKPETIMSANQSIPPVEITEKDKTTSVPIPQVISLTIMSINTRPFAGYDLINALEANYLHYGEYDIYHRYKYKNGKGPLYFSIASVVKPGALNPKKLGDLSTPGLILFMPLNNPKHDRVVFKQILSTAHQIARSLGGVVCDDKRIPLRETTMRAYAEKLNL